MFSKVCYAVAAVLFGVVAVLVLVGGGGAVKALEPIGFALISFGLFIAPG